MQRIFWVGLGLLWLVSVSGLAAELVDCPKKDTDDGLVFLQSGEKKCVKLEVKLAKRSETIKNIIENDVTEIEGPIPVPNMNNETLLDVVSVLELIAENEQKKDAKHDADEAAQQAIVQVVPKDNPARLKRLLIASNYLDIPAVLQGCVSLYADKILKDDLGNLGEKEKTAYITYKKDFFEDVPKVIQRLLAQKAVLPNHIATFRHDDTIWSVAFSPDGRRVLTGTGDNTAKLWDPKAQGDNKVPLATFQHDNDVQSVAFSPDGTRVLTGSDDNTAKLWNANARGANIAPLATFRHDDSVTSVAFSPDGTRVLTAGDDDTTKLWALFDAQKLTNPLAEAQIMLFVQQNKLTKANTPKHLVAELSAYAKNYLWGE